MLEALVYMSWNYDWKPSLAKNAVENSHHESARLALKSLNIPMEYHGIEYITLM